MRVYACMHADTSRTPAPCPQHTQLLLIFPTDSGDLNSGPRANEMQQTEPSPLPFLSHFVLFEDGILLRIPDRPPTHDPLASVSQISGIPGEQHRTISFAFLFLSQISFLSASYVLGDVAAEPSKMLKASECRCPDGHPCLLASTVVPPSTTVDPLRSTA